MKDAKSTAIFSAVLAAALYALSAPLSKLLLQTITPAMLAALLYLGAGIGVFAVRRLRRGGGETPLVRADAPYVIGMVALDVAAPILLMLGLAKTTAANAALLNNFEIVATALIALLVFGEAISRRLWLAIALVTAASALLSFEGASSLSFSVGSAFVLLACVCWGMENNCTRKISGKDPLQIVVVKGFGSGLGALGIALARGERLPAFGPLLCALALGFVAYGLSIACYIRAQRTLGAARTSAYYAIAPFVGAALSLAIFREALTPLFGAALLLMLAGAYLAAERAPRAK